ncbi:hypothetical protein CXU03_02985 [Akkermansia muciniphila]|nr:hypothetical protein CXU03_02985 [Akkermansia muciniphila]
MPGCPFSLLPVFSKNRESTGRIILIFPFPARLGRLGVRFQPGPLEIHGGFPVWKSGLIKLSVHYLSFGIKMLESDFPIE